MAKLTYNVSGIMQEGTRTLFGGGSLSYAPDELVKKILNRQADVVVRALEKSGHERLNVKGKSQHITEKSFKKKNIKRDANGDRYKDVLPTGERPNGKNKTKRKAEVAFLNEHGVPSKRMVARQFIAAAIDAVEDELVKIAQEALEKYYDI